MDIVQSSCFNFAGFNFAAFLAQNVLEQYALTLPTCFNFAAFWPKYPFFYSLSVNVF